MGKFRICGQAHHGESSTRFNGYPNEGEQWGSLPDGKNAPIQTMKDTKFYQQNLFGLQTADAANKISFEQTPGDHLQFTDAELYGWVDKYFMATDRVVV